MAKTKKVNENEIDAQQTVASPETNTFKTRQQIVQMRKILEQKPEVERIPEEKFKAMTVAEADKWISENRQGVDFSKPLAYELTAKMSISQKIALERAVGNGQLEPIPKEQFAQLTVNDAKKILAGVREKYPDMTPASDRQKEMIASLSESRNIYPVSDKQMSEMTKVNASVIISKGLDRRQRGVTVNQTPYYERSENQPADFDKLKKLKELSDEGWLTPVSKSQRHQLTNGKADFLIAKGEKNRSEGIKPEPFVPEKAAPAKEKSPAGIDF